MARARGGANRAPKGARAGGGALGGYHCPSDAIHQPGPGGAGRGAEGWRSGGYHLPSDAIHQPGPGGAGGGGGDVAGGWVPCWGG